MDPVAFQFIDEEAKLSRHNSTNSSKRGRRNNNNDRELINIKTPARTSIRRQGSNRKGVKRANSVRSNLSTHDNNCKEDKEILTPKEIRRRRVVLIVLITFTFLLVSSILVVVVTLTQTAFHSNNKIPYDGKCLFIYYYFKVKAMFYQS